MCGSKQSRPFMRKKISIIGSGKCQAATAMWVARKELGDIVLYNWDTRIGSRQGLGLEGILAGGRLRSGDRRHGSAGRYRETRM